MYHLCEGRRYCTHLDQPHTDAASVVLHRAALEREYYIDVMVSPWKCFLIVFVCVCWVHASPDDGQVKRRSLQFNLCRAFNTEEFVCDNILGHFCTFCVKPDEPEASAFKTICETKANAKRASRGEASSRCLL